MMKKGLVRRVTAEPTIRKRSLRKRSLGTGRRYFEGITLYPPERETFAPVVRTSGEEWALAGKSVARDWLEVGNGLRRAMGKEEIDPKVLEQE